MFKYKKKPTSLNAITICILYMDPGTTVVAKSDKLILYSTHYINYYVHK